jgi:polygalacturonase
MIQFYNCRNVTIEDISLVDSPGWTCWFIGCRDMVINRIKIRGDQAMINNDGIDFDGCSNVTVSDCVIETGDDCLVLRAIRRDTVNQFVCENVLVNNCVLNSRCQGVRIGCPSDDTIRNCAFRNIIFNGDGAGINCNNPYRYLRKECEGYLHVENIVFSNWQIRAGRQPFTINVEAGLKLRKIDSIVYENFTIYAKEPIELIGTASTNLGTITLRNISGTIYAATALKTSFVSGLILSDLRLSAVTGVPAAFERKKSDSWESMF